MRFNFICDICNKKVKDGWKFTIDSTEWESEHIGGYGGLCEESICVDCRNTIRDKIESMK